MQIIYKENKHVDFKVLRLPEQPDLCPFEDFVKVLRSELSS